MKPIIFLLLCILLLFMFVMVACIIVFVADQIEKFRLLTIDIYNKLDAPPQLTQNILNSLIPNLKTILIVLAKILIIILIAICILAVESYLVGKT